MDTALTLVVVLTIVVAVSSLASRVGISAPLVLTVFGAVVSYVSFVPDYELTPELVLIGLLPPLLYSAAIRTSLVDFHEHKRAIMLLSVGLVIFTAFGIGLLMWAVLPISFAAALALGAVVAPPDAVAATTIARRVGFAPTCRQHSRGREPCQRRHCDRDTAYRHCGRCGIGFRMGDRRRIHSLGSRRRGDRLRDRIYCGPASQTHSRRPDRCRRVLVDSLGGISTGRSGPHPGRRRESVWRFGGCRGRFDPWPQIAHYPVRIVTNDRTHQLGNNRIRS